MDKIIVKGAKENNLKNVSVEIPRNKFVVFTGLSGSGKVHLHLTQFMKRAEEDMLIVFQVMHANF